MKLLFAIFFLFSSLSWAQGPNCHSVYTEQFNAKIYAQQLGIQESRDFLSRYFFKKYLKKWNPEKTYTHETFQKRIIESYDLLRKLKIRQGLLDNRDRDFNARPEEIVTWAEMALMKEGLKGYLYNIPSYRRISDKIYLKVSQITQSKLMKLLYGLATQSIPEKFDREIPKELLAKVLVDGLDPHFTELQKAYKLSGQNKNEDYLRIRRALKYFVLTFSALSSFHQLEQMDIRAKAAQEQTRIDSQAQFETMNKTLDELEATIDAL